MLVIVCFFLFVMCFCVYDRLLSCFVFFCFKQKTAYEVRISDWSSDVCSSDLDRGKVVGYRAQIEGPDGVPIVNTIPGDDPFDFDASTSARFKKGTVTGKVGVDFKTADNDLIYASFSRGYRANAFNAPAYFSPAELNVAEPETVNAYEPGFKSQ